MKKLCITGNGDGSLENFARVIVQGGAKPPLSSLENQDLDIYEWHRQATATLANPQPDSSKPVAISRTLKKKAHDILAYNNEQLLWHWADKLSIRFLDFWLRLDPNIYFIMLYTSPESALVDAVRKGASNEKMLGAALEDWNQRTRAMIRFYARNKNRCEFIAQDEPKSQLTAIAKKWDMPIKVAPLQFEPVSDINHLERYLLTEFITYNLKTQVLIKESCLHLTAEMKKTVPPAAAPIARALDAYLAYRHTSSNSEETKNLVNTNKKIASNPENYGTLADSSNLVYTPEENEKLLTQLHTAQEDQEYYLSLYKNIQRQLLEQTDRIKKLSKLNPNYWEIESLEVKLAQGEEGNEVAEWTIKKLYIGDHLIPELRLKTLLDNGIAGVVIERTPGESPLTAWLEWPDMYANSCSLPCTPTTGGIYQGNNTIISSLGTTDWNNFRGLVRNMIKTLETSNDTRFHVEIDPMPLHKGLTNLEKILSSWPLILRYDSIEIVDTFKFQDYHRIELNLTNLSFGELFWPSLNYRLGTVHENESFGQNPRLEFLENTSNAFENWFTEADEIRGPRLEIRFAKPYAMDTNVWNELSDKDQILVAGIINSIPKQLESIQKKQPSATLHWENWHDLSRDVKAIFNFHLKIQSNKTDQ